MSEAVVEMQEAVAEMEEEDEDTLFIVQHAVVVQNGDNIHAVNDLLLAGWRVMQTANLTEGALLVLETRGTEDSINELRRSLGYKEE